MRGFYSKEGETSLILSSNEAFRGKGPTGEERKPENSMKDHGVPLKDLNSKTGRLEKPSPKN